MIVEKTNAFSTSQDTRFGKLRNKSRNLSKLYIGANAIFLDRVFFLLYSLPRREMVKYLLLQLQATGNKLLRFSGTDRTSHYSSLSPQF
jgi:hypothetical protein